MKGLIYVTETSKGKSIEHAYLTDGLCGDALISKWNQQGFNGMYKYHKISEYQTNLKEEDVKFVHRYV